MNKLSKILMLILIGACAAGAGFLVDGFWSFGDPAVIEEIGIEEFKQMEENPDLQIIDVRSQQEFELGHIPNAEPCPASDLNKETVKRFDTSKPTVVYCSADYCTLSEDAAEKLGRFGFTEIYILTEGIEGYTGELDGGGETCIITPELEENGGINIKYLSTIITLGLIDGVNPCAIAVMVFLLGYLITFAEQKERLWWTGIIYIATTYITYVLIGLVFVRSIEALLALPSYLAISMAINLLLGITLIVAGALNLKDFFWFGRGPFLGIQKGTFPKIKELISKATYPLVILLAVLVTLFEAPCSLPLYLGTSKLIADSSNSLWQTFEYLGIYNLMFILPLVVMLIIIGVTSNLVYVKEFEHRGKKWMKLVMGTVLIFVGAILLF